MDILKQPVQPMARFMLNVFTRVSRISILSLALILLGFSARADVPSGTINFAFTNTTPVLFDFSTTLHFEQQIEGGTTLSFDLSLDNAGNGRLTSAGTTIVTIGNDTVAGDYTAVGRISSGKSGTTLIMAVKFRGQDTIAGVLTPFQINVTYRLALNHASNSFVGTARGSANLGSLGTSKINSPIQVAIPDNQDGTFNIQLNIVSLKKLGGTATITLSDGRVLQLKVVGKYSPALNLAKLRLVGVGAQKGLILGLNFVTIDGTSTIVSMRGRILGQTVVQ
jgi:hypothetical protein